MWFLETYWLNLGSIVLGLLAWILPIVSIIHVNKRWITFSIASLVACAISLCFQISYTKYLVRKEDWSALMDTADATALVSSVLLIVTILLNAVALFLYRRKKS